MLGLLVEGCSTAEIARALAVPPETVDVHLRDILGKLSAPPPILAALRAERDGLYVPHRCP